MIENIKNFVNEHQIFIVVIISVLFICFLYWWFCCKDRPLVNKVKGGGPVVRELPLKVEGNVCIFECIGKYIDPGLTFLALNESGEDKVREINSALFKINKPFSSLIMFKEVGGIQLDRMKILMTNPFYFFDNNNTQYNVSQYLELSPNSLYRNEDIHEIKSDDLDRFTQTLFLPTMKCRNELMLAYDEMNTFLLSHAANYINKVKFIGQPSYYSTRDPVSVQSCEKKFFGFITQIILV